MASTIAAVTTSGGGVVTTADASGNLNLLAGTTTVVALTTAGAAVSGTLSNTTGATFATSSGNVGIGTSSPSQKLEVSGIALIKTTNPYLLLTDTTSSGSTWRIQGNVAALGDIGFYDQTNSRTALVINSSGNVGVGTSSLSYKLEVNGTINIANGSSVGWGNQQTTITGSTATNVMQFYTAAVERMRIDSSGNLLVGVTASIGGLNASGHFKNVNAGAAGIVVGNAGGTSTTNTILFTNSNGTVGGISTSGSATAFNTSSDYRLKNTITPMTGALDKVALLKPVTYKWNVDGSDGQGFIAHELAEVEPNCVTGEKDATREEEYEITPAVPAVLDAEGVETTPAVQAVKGIRTVPSYQGVDTSFLVATLTAAIQELKAIIDTQAARIAALEAK